MAPAFYGALFTRVFPFFFITSPPSSSLCASTVFFDPIPIATFTSAFAQVHVVPSLPSLDEKRNGGPLNQKLTIYFKYQLTICGGGVHIPHLFFFFNQLPLIYF
jgi:hypothetical protein